jgi:hypothetical protein
MLAKSAYLGSKFIEVSSPVLVEEKNSSFVASNASWGLISICNLQ